MVKRADVVIVGAGPAGMSAASVAAQLGSVLLLDDNPRMGGQIWRYPSRLPIKFRSTRFPLSFEGGIEVVGPISGNALLAQRSGESMRIEYGSLVLATGARERFLPFPGWTLPNVLGAGGLQAITKGASFVRGKRVVVAGTGPLLLAVAAHLKSAGAQVLAVAEQAAFSQVRQIVPWVLRSPGKAFQAAGLRAALVGVPYRYGAYIKRAEGDQALQGVLLHDNGHERWIDCDYLALGYHLAPNTELAESLGCELREGFVSADHNQQTTVEGVFAAGEVTGIGGVRKAIEEGRRAGEAACGELLGSSSPMPIDPFAAAMDRAFALRPELLDLAEPDTIVCRCEDVRMRDLEPFTSWREAKLQTRCGMGPCQGRVCGPILEAIKGWKRESVRPPVVACRVGSLIGEESEE